MGNVYRNLILITLLNCYAKIVSDIEKNSDVEIIHIQEGNPNIMCIKIEYKQVKLP